MNYYNERLFEAAFGRDLDMVYVISHTTGHLYDDDATRVVVATEDDETAFGYADAMIDEDIELHPERKWFAWERVGIENPFPKWRRGEDSKGDYFEIWTIDKVEMI